ncbi:DUF6221 family protein [Streptomyces sp. NPDC057540]|uniref:DUF6221 family protein n=1 Tax=Streptomyces sp. NPDC057540 TaxID=3346160 RepID=UPI003694086A
MDDLIAFLRARLNEDADLALAASPGPWHPGEEHDEVLAVDDIVVAEGFALSGRQLRATVDHIARHDPARVLAEVDAKGRLVDLTSGMLSAAEGDSEVDHYGGLDAAEAVLRATALPFAEHPDYQDAWRP